ncbi:MAG: SDR family oxidoreductase [Myxococcota bacterium]
MALALVTGAYKGLGLEWCRQLGKDGYTVILTARRLDKAEPAAKQLAQEGLTVIPKALDVADEEGIAQLANDLGNAYGKLDVLINNAGINAKDDPNPNVVAQNAKLSMLNPEEILRHVRINSIAPVLMVKHFRSLLAQSDRPLVVSISSWLGSISIKTTNLANYSYSTSKAALNMMNRAMAIEVKEEGIIALVVNPGWVVTDMGGQKATLTPEQSVRGVIDNVLNKVTLEDSGNFYQWDGTTHPW